MPGSGSSSPRPGGPCPELIGPTVHLLDTCLGTWEKVNVGTRRKAVFVFVFNLFILN